MSRFELTISGGEKLFVEHPATAMNDLLAQLRGSTFLLFAEVRAGSPGREVIISSSQITLVRQVAEGSTQGSTFRPKR